jgi:alpha-L-fucosidase 2
MTSPPTATPSAHVPDGPLMGNGHMTAVVGGTAAAQTYYINATDFWKDNVPKTIGGVTVSIPALAGAGTNYKQEQDIGNAEVRSTFMTSASTIQLRSWISANELAGIP